MTLPGRTMRSQPMASREAMREREERGRPPQPGLAGS